MPLVGAEAAGGGGLLAQPEMPVRVPRLVPATSFASVSSILSFRAGAEKPPNTTE